MSAQFEHTCNKMPKVLNIILEALGTLGDKLLPAKIRDAAIMPA